MFSLETIFIFIVVIVGLITVHEMGHFVAARCLGVTVTKFAIGFGKEIFSFTINETTYSFNIIPLGGYINLLGESHQDTISKENIDRAFSFKPIWVRFVIIAAGPFVNVLTCLLLLFALYSTTGVPFRDVSATINEVLPHTPAARANLQSGDIIIAINGTSFSGWDEMKQMIQENQGSPMMFTVLKKRQQVDVQLIPDKITTAGKTMFRIGVKKHSFRSFTPTHGFLDTFAKTIQTLSGFFVGTIAGIAGLLFSSSSTMENVGGPIAIVKMTGHNYSLGWPHLTYLTAMLSLNLGLLNLVPIPMLDGGRIVGLAIEKIRKGRKMPSHIVFIANLTGQILLAVIFYTVIFNDIARMILK